MKTKTNKEYDLKKDLEMISKVFVLDENREFLYVDNIKDNKLKNLKIIK